MSKPINHAEGNILLIVVDKFYTSSSSTIWRMKKLWKPVDENNGKNLRMKIHGETIYCLPSCLWTTSVTTDVTTFMTKIEISA